jgi:radical SAM protein with 4Fe4S-binding SPASM domain
MVDLYRRARDEGFGVGRGGLPRMGVCRFHTVSSLAVVPNGDIYACDELLGHPDLCVGNIRDTDVDAYLEASGRLASLRPWESDARCRDCRCLPLCRGGCRAMAFRETGGDWQAVECWRDYYEALVRGFLEMECSALAERPADVRGEACTMSGV